MCWRGASSTSPFSRRSPRSCITRPAPPPGFPSRRFATLDTFRLSASDADWTVGGRIGLDGRLDCPVTARIPTSQFAAGSDLATAAALVAGPDGRIEVGLKLGGTLTSPTVDVDLAPLFEAARKKGTESLENELKKRLGDLLKRKP
ncbi:MAG: hypothetical protein FD129_1353 [bacterium]|nr:MAG: hypothetical protein FD129_1353 [bacterium]